MAACVHLQQVEREPSPAKPSSQGCLECLQTGSPWVHLRICLTCGHVGCCDSSPNRHATRHFHAVGHPVIKSYEPGEDWAWCYVDEATADRIPALPEQRPSAHLSPPSDRG